MIRINKQRLILSLPYVLFPIVGIVTRIADIQSALTRNWIDLTWFVILVISISAFFINRGKDGPLDNRSIAIVIAFSLLILGIFLLKYGISYINHSVSYIPYLMEAKPFFYLLSASIWVIAFGAPENEDFVRVGVWLGLIIILEFVIESFLAGRIVRILGSGEINYDASLLLISICASLVGKRYKPVHQLILYLAVVITFSRTALATAILIIFFFSSVNIAIKLLFSGVSLSSIILSFVIRDLPITIISADRYWMWKTAILLFAENKWRLLWGWPIGVSLPVSIPPALDYLWITQQQNWGLDGIYQFNFHAFWLRIAISWGIPITILMLLLIAAILIFPGRIFRDLKGIALFCLIGGLTMGLIYLSNVSVPLILAFWSFSRAGKQF